MKYITLRINRINFWITNSLANANATPWAFWFVSVLVLNTLRYARPADPLGWINFIIQTFYQGAALPLLAFVGKNEAAKLYTLVTDIYTGITSSLEMIKHMLHEAKKERQQMKILLHEMRDERKLMLDIRERMAQLDGKVSDN